jgi:mono/diheme cytochrome c family protein
MSKLGFALALLLTVPAVLVCQSSPPATAADYKIPPEAKSHANPVKSTPESLARGKKLYSYECALCHGKDGDAKGDMPDMKNITNFTDPTALKDLSDGELFYIIEKGKGEMPGEAGRAKNEDMWNLVNYIRSFAKKG